MLPSFYTTMTFKEKVTKLLEEGLLEKPSLFLVDLSISESYKITVTLDGDNGVNLQDCIDVSRVIENNLDREEQDFSLEVASAGVSTPLKLVRQYKKKYWQNVESKNRYRNNRSKTGSSFRRKYNAFVDCKRTKKSG